MVKTEYYQIKEGVAEEIEKMDIGHGRVSPAGNEVLTLPKKGMFGSERRLALYPINSPTPIPVGAPVVIGPKAFGVADLQNLLGPYISSLVKRSLSLEVEEKLKVKDWVIMAIAGTGTLLSGIGLYFSYAVAKALGLL